MIVKIKMITRTTTTIIIKIIFKESITGYQNALTNSNFKHKLKYSNHQSNQTKMKPAPTRKTIFFNPPYCQSVRTNITIFSANNRQTFERILQAKQNNK